MTPSLGQQKNGSVTAAFSIGIIVNEAAHRIPFELASIEKKALFDGRYDFKRAFAVNCPKLASVAPSGIN